VSVDGARFEAEHAELMLELFDAFLASRERLLAGVLSVQRLEGGLVCDPVGGELSGALEALDRVRGPWSVASVVGSGFKPQSGELALELPDALGTPGERPVGGADPQRRQRGGVRDAVGGEAADLLEPFDGLCGLGPVASVHDARVKSQPAQLALQRLDPLDPLLGWVWFIDIHGSWTVDCAVIACICG
jgi:hypothetical protein